MTIAPLLSKLVPATLALKGITKLNTKLGKFIVDATAYGYGADQILDYLRNQFDSQPSSQERKRLESGAPNLRPDEQSSLQQMKQRESFPRALQKGLGVAASTIAGIGALEDEDKLQEPQNVQRSVPAVSPMQEEQMEPPRPKSVPAGILEALSPKLKAFIEDRLAAGSDLNKIASLAKSHFFDEIKQIQDESGMPFRDFLESLYGQQRQTARVMGLQQQEQNAGKQNLANSIMQAVEMMRQMRGQ